MKFLIGLGNPGRKYQKTRHNLGFRIAEVLAQTLGIDFSLSKKFLAKIAKGQELLIAKPQTFMNDSGRAIQKLLTAYHLKTTDLLVIHDEIDLPLGTIRLSKNSSSAGHKGVESITKKIGKNFARLRIGIENREQARIPVTEKYVLQNFTAEENKILETNTIPNAIREIQKVWKLEITCPPLKS